MKYTQKHYPEYREAVEKMTVDELLAAVVCPATDRNSPPIKGTQAVFLGMAPRDILDKQVEGINGSDRDLPALLVADMEFGAGDSVEGAVRFPSFRAAADSGSEELCYKMGKIAAMESLEAGYHWTFGPCVDILSNHLNPIVSYRTAGDDADTVIKYGGAYMRGLQENGMISTLKHFPGDGYCIDDQHITTPDNPLSRDEWDATFGRVYSELIEEGAMAIMPGHIALPSYDEIDPVTRLYPPATISKRLLTGLLREQLGFDGIIVSDAVTMNGFCGYCNLYQASALFIEAGGDSLLFMPLNDDYINGMKHQIELGNLSLKTLRERAYRMMCFRRDYFDNMYPTVRKKPSPEEAEEAVRGVCSAGVQIVRDRGELLPFAKGKRVAHAVVPNASNDDFSCVEDLTRKLKEVCSEVEELRDVGPGVLCDIASHKKYDLIICSVMNMPRFGTNIVEIGGPVARNFMCGWTKYDVPVIFVVYGSPFFADVYRASADTVINTNGYGDYTNEYVMKKIFG